MYSDWISEHLPAPLTGPLETTKDELWSFVAKAPTAHGMFWFKENRAGTVYEAALVAALAAWAPDQVLTPVAVHIDRGWSLLPDGGPTLREADGEPDLGHWEHLLTQHAQLQRDLSGRVDELIALGVPDLRPTRLAEAVAALDAPPAVRDYLPTYLQLCQELAASPIPASLQHDDLHDANVFTSGRFFDWGDASVAHPFAVLLISLRVAASKFNVKAGDPLLARLRDAYLEPWSDLAPRTQLLRDVDLAIQTGKGGRSLSWQRSLRDATPEQVAKFEDPVSGWLEELLEPNVL